MHFFSLSGARPIAHLKVISGRLWLSVFLLILPSYGNGQPTIESSKALGPIPLVNQAPPLTPFLQPAPDRAATLPRGSFELRLTSAMTNTLVFQSSDHYEGLADMETLNWVIGLKASPGHGLEFDLSLPFYYSYSGFMDEIILDVERTFGKPRAVREEETPYRYGYRIRKDGRVFIGGEKTFSGAGDISFVSKWNFLKEDSLLPSMSTRLSIKIPSGSRERSLSSGKADCGIGLLLQKGFGRFIGYFNADLIIPGHAYEESGVSIRNFYILLLGAEYHLTERLSLTAQVKTTTRPFEKTGLQMLDRRINDLLIGFNYLWEGGLFIQGGGVEDFRDSTEAGADITFFLILGKRFS